jgi:hypothetical protein
MLFLTFILDTGNSFLGTTHCINKNYSDTTRSLLQEKIFLVDNVL